jgi:hypothetical protein
MTTNDEQGRSTEPIERAAGSTEPTESLDQPTVSLERPTESLEQSTESLDRPTEVLREQPAGSGERPADPATVAEQPASAATSEEHAAAGAEEQAVVGTAATPMAAPAIPRSRRIAQRWRGSRPLRIGTAVLAALVIAGVGFGAGFAAGGHDDHPHHGEGGRHLADHRFHPGGLPWMYRFEHGPRDEGPRAERPALPQQPGTATPAPAPTH